MEEHRNQIAVERRLKEAMKHDRARIQVGRISPFGLLEMSRQRLRPSIVEASTQPCPHCGGTGHIRSTESTALHVLRAIEEEGIRRRTAEISVAVPTSVALYILNQKRAMLAAAEERYHFRVSITRDDTLIPPNMRLERVRALTAEEIAALPPLTVSDSAYLEEEEEEIEEATIEEAEAEPAPAETASAEPRPERHREPEPRAEGDEAQGRRRRRRRRRGGRREGEPRETQNFAEPLEGRAFAEVHEVAAEELATGEAMDPIVDQGAGEAQTGPSEQEPPHENGDGQRKRRRRGRRGGRRRRRGGSEGFREPAAAEGAEPMPGPGYEREPERAPEASWSREPERAPEAAWTREPETPRWPDRGARGGDAGSSAPRPEAEPQPPPAPEPREHEHAAAEKPAEPAPAGGANVPPPVTVTERPANPKRGWWHRLTQS